MEQTPQLELPEFEQEPESVTHILYANGDISKPLPPFRGMALGKGTPKMYGEWLRMYLLVGPHGQLNSKAKSLKKRTNSTNSREYGWVCSDSACNWNVHITRSSDTSVWKVKSCDDHSEGCTSVANPTQREMLNLLKNIPCESHNMSDLMVKVEAAFGVTRDKALYRKLWNAKNILFGKRDIVGSSPPLIDPIPVLTHGGMQGAMVNPVTGENGEILDLNLHGVAGDQHGNVTVQYVDPSTLPPQSLDVRYILYANGHHLTPRLPFYGMNLGPGHPKIYGDWLRMTQLFSPSGELLPRQRGIKKGVNTTNSKQYSWRCADPNCTWRVDIVWRKKRNCWFVKGLSDHTEQCTSTATVSQAVVANILDCKASPNAGSISDLMQTVEALGIPVEEKAYSKFWHAKNMLTKRKAEAPLTSSHDTRKAVRAEKAAKKKQKIDVVGEVEVPMVPHVHHTLTDMPSLTGVVSSNTETIALPSIQDLSAGEYPTHLPPNMAISGDMFV